MQPTRRIRRRTRAGKRRRAVTLVLVAVGLATMLALCGLAVDVGHICVARSELQRTADAGALASAAVMLDVYDLNETPIPHYVSCEARDEAIKYVALNPCRGKTLTMPQNDANAATGDLVLGHYTSETDSFDPTDTKYNSIELLVRRDAVQNGSLPLFFGPLIGVSAVDVQAGAAAFIETDVKGFQVGDGDSVTCKLLPFTIQIGLWKSRVAEGRDDYTHDPDNQAVYTGGDGIEEIKLFPYDLSPGNFGTLDLGSSNNSTADLSRQILYGLNAFDFSFFPDNTIQLDTDWTLILDGDTGISAGTKDELAAIAGQPRIIPLFSTMSGEGDNASFTVVAFVGVTIVDSRLVGATMTKHITIQPCYTVDSTAIGGGNDGTTSKFVRTPPRLRKKKLR